MFAPVRPRLARWEHKRLQGARSTTGNGGISDSQKHCYLKTLGIRQIVPTKFGKFKGTVCQKNRQTVRQVRQIGFRQIVFPQIVPNPKKTSVEIFVRIEWVVFAEIKKSRKMDVFWPFLG